MGIHEYYTYGTDQATFDSVEPWHAVDIEIPRDTIKKLGIWKLLWGTDIFINRVPFLKCLVAANVLVWLLFWVTK